MEPGDPPPAKEEPQKAYGQVLLNEVNAGLAEFRRPTAGLLLSSLSGGLDVSFSLLLMATMRTLVEPSFSRAATELLVANMYAVGFIFVVIGRSELFTEHTSRALFPVLSGYASPAALARLWAIVYCGNLLGVAAFAGTLAAIGPQMGVVDDSSFEAISRRFVESPWWLTVASAALAGWLMGLLSWLVSACRDTISQIVIVWLVATAIGLTQLPHAIVTSGEVLANTFIGRTTVAEFLSFLLPTTLGNSLGGAFFVAALKYGHSSRSASNGDSNKLKRQSGSTNQPRPT
ncbi:MAG TPA: formate/nitrite transporter family protein [Pirellulales bacterium]|nr:formate/nitrite transporter family protein [Pirellulales bacterium]